MARLTQDMVNTQTERFKKEEEALRKKAEILRKKELYGENWKKVEEKKIIQNVEAEIGSDNAPKLYDFKDRYDFFDPIIVYRDEDNKILQIDYDKFIESEQKYQKEIDNINDIIVVKEEKKTKKKSVNNAQDDKTSLTDDLKEDGDDLEDEVIPLPVTETEETSLPKTPRSRAKGRLNDIMSKYFSRFVPVYNKYVCSCCGTPKRLEDYYIVYNIACGARVDVKGSYHMTICKECCQRLFAYLYTQISGKNVELAMQLLCSYLNLYWDLDLLQVARKNFEESDRRGTLVGSYIITINKEAPGKTFMDSPFLTEEHYSATVREVEKDDTPYDWTAEEAKNKKDVIKLLGYDPFTYCDDDNDRKILYADLISILDEDIQQDYVKLQSALTIVKSFTKVRKLDEKLHQMELNDDPLNEQKSVADLKAKELKAISDFSRDSGFAERFKTKQSQGQTSFTGIMKTMDEKKYENELINKYDIQTSSTIQAASDASFKSIFGQLNLSDAEVYKICADQLDELRKLRKEKDKLEEDLRKEKYKNAELSLREKAKEKGVDVDD